MFLRVLVGEMVQQVDVLTSKLDNMSPIPRAHMEGEDLFPQTIL